MKTQVLIIGAGATGTGLIRDLALRGVHCLLVEQADINAGASGSNHGLLHSGARYIATDPETAKECRDENILLKQLAAQCIENTGGLFVAIAGDDENYIADFPNLCARAGLPCRHIDPKDALAIEPALSNQVVAAYRVEDATLDPFKLTLENLSHAQQLGARYLPHTRVVGFKKAENRIVAVQLHQNRSGKTLHIYPDQVVNAAGAWAGEITALAGASIDLIYSKGSLLVSHNRITHRVINRLHRPADGDILVPGGTVSLLGTTSVRVQNLKDIRPTVAEIDRIVDNASRMIPSLSTLRYTRAYAGVRPLINQHSAKGDDRRVSRGFVLLDHTEEGLENFTTIAGGKLTTYRLMAEKTADLVCARLGIHTQCRTRIEPLPPDPVGKWTEPGLAPRLWLANSPGTDNLICECEMVPQSVINTLLDSLNRQNMLPSLGALSVRSRLGKGPCQGAFCGLRAITHMYNLGKLSSDEGMAQLAEFFSKRWKGQRPVLWNGQLAQAALSEAIHCGLLGLELENAWEPEH